MIITKPPFIFPSSQVDAFNVRPDIRGCNSTEGTTFVLHPQITSAILAGGGTMFFSYSVSTYKTGSLQYNGLGGNALIQNIGLTSLSGSIPGTGGQLFILIDQTGIVDTIAIFGVGLSAGSLTSVRFASGEAKANWLNFQQYGPGAASYTGVTLSGQGPGKVANSIFANSQLDAISCNGHCVLDNVYAAQVRSGVQCVAACTVTITSSELRGASTSGNPLIGDNGNVGTFYVFGNPAIINGLANFAPIQLTNSSSVLDISGSTVTSLTAGYPVTGTGQVNDRAGNTWSSPLTQFTGTYVPIGGGSVATNKATAATNIDTNIGATNIVAASIATATYDVKIGFRQVTAGVGCGAGSNTVNGVLSWTAGGAAQATGSNGVPALATLTVSANGTVGTSSVYSSVPVHADINTAITFTTTATLASAGCSTKPQYVVDYSNI
jgi:hypothetical protein